MPYKTPEAKKQWNDAHKEYKKQWEKTHDAELRLKKRCPECNKEIKIKINKLNTGQKYTMCKNKECSCYSLYGKIKISHTFSTNTHAGNTHGIKLKVIA